MGRTLREALTEADLAKLSEAMDWVIPPDSSPGAGSQPCVGHLIELVDSLGSAVADTYRISLRNLVEADLADAKNVFAQTFIEHVRDVYYSYPDTGAWGDIGFRVT